MLKFKKGFTMIELLIVITILGILAVAVLSAINPIEQMNRGRDTGSRSDAEQLLSAVDRFYATQGHYPWQTGEDDDANLPTIWADVEDTNWADSATVAVLDKLSGAAGVGTAELRQSFVTRITGATYNTLIKYNRGTAGDSTYVCFQPRSASFRAEAIRRCGGTAGACTGLPVDLRSVANCDTVICGGGILTTMSCLP